MRISIIGVGGIGSHLAGAVAAVLEYRAPGSALFLVDGDHFEPKNTERQVFDAYGNKAESLAATLQRRFPNTFVIPRPQFVVADNQVEGPSHLAVSELMAEGDIVLPVVDNYAARAICFDYARSLENIDVITGGNDDSFEGSLYHYQRRDGRDITDHPAEYHAEFVDPPDRNPGLMSCGERAMLDGGQQLIATNMSVAAHLCARVILTMTDQISPDAAEVFWDLGQAKMVAYDRAADLPAELPV